MMVRRRGSQYLNSRDPIRAATDGQARYLFALDFHDPDLDISRFTIHASMSVGRNQGATRWAHLQRKPRRVGLTRGRKTRPGNSTTTDGRDVKCFARGVGGSACGRGVRSRRSLRPCCPQWSSRKTRSGHRRRIEGDGDERPELHHLFRRRGTGQLRSEPDHLVRPRVHVHSKLHAHHRLHTTRVSRNWRGDTARRTRRSTAADPSIRRDHRPR